MASNDSVGARDSLDDRAAGALSRDYRQCVDEAGFELRHVSVHDLPDVGLMVKTDVDVPAPIHGSCLESIGGSTTDLSSWGL